ncbi:hypothetical protein PF005_g29008 [Phytophthora fragariae]|uniref:Ubiquitin carboxyl-terminal hydrolase n=1 Tax=Phytophthora fragariae TaxID=53985 RepID=A0A6A3VJL1_9STRA|nr:hypothetical protein PF003_g2293 [Phytophthora fragariae]KAE8920227.1 hypothetical protein PF009_g29476 [Phytophthora fragariae]KAE8966068.1 hypothetical protein PF011_g28068 [Phytophthora fragariae]KAE9064492.1 hypothetical protein PF010_g28587 [Phytophthora fragariae]KAE9065365.1 hypothetical protein PF007_g28869 [Phytophthora fragariae]
MMKEGDSRTGEKRGRLLSSGTMCVHFRQEHVAAWKQLLAVKAAKTAADVAQLQHYLVDQEASAELSSEVYRCLTCKFRGSREASRQQMQEIEDGEDDGSFMAHAILHNHNIAVMERKWQLYCACCRDFIYPDAAMGGGSRRRKRQLRGMATPHRLLRRGLVNMGNTCFMSSVLQALAHNPMLQHYFFVARSHDTTICQQQRQRLLLKKQEQLKAEKQKERGEEEEEDDGERQNDTKRGPDPAITVCLGCELAAFMALLVPPSAHLAGKALAASPIAPQGILEAMWNAFPSFIGTAQHDAHELLIALLGGLHSHTHPRVFVHGGASPRFTPRGHSLCDCAVHQHFSGVLRSELACGGCGFASHKFDPFLDVSLSLDDGNIKDEKREVVKNESSGMSTISLESLLRQFAAEEELRGSNQVYCRRCSKYQNNYKSLNLHTLPNVLVFHIRRLDFYRQQKLMQIVQFPLVGLNMRPFTSVGIDESSKRKKGDRKAAVPGRAEGDQSEYVYDLVAVLNHHGVSVNGGHYTSYVRDEISSPQSPNSKQQQWILFDDVEMKTVLSDEVENSQAYLLYYVRRNPFIAVAA